MQLRVENLGPIREAEVDLSQRLIVLTGPNNKGKTWFAWTVYALVRAAAGADVPLAIEHRLTSERRTVSLGPEVTLPLASQLVEAATAQVTSDLSDVFASTRAFFTSTRLHWSVAPRVFETRTAAEDRIVASVNVSSQNARVRARLHRTPPSVHFELELTPRKDAAQGELPLDFESIAESQSLAASRLCKHLLGLSERPTLFPAERLAVNLFARELAASRTELIEEALVADEQGEDPAAVIRRAGRFPLPIRDSLSTATRLDTLSRRESQFADVALELERALLGGSIRANDRGELRFAPHGTEVSLPVHMSASVVKSLASLTFYFRHLARPGAFLIIDEPELNLHPDAQRKVARFLGKVINRGFKVMISTHSDFVVRELSHLVMMGSAGDEGLAVARELGYDADSLLTPDKVGAWLFNAGTATRIPVDATGFGVRTIDDEISRMNADSQRIYARLVG